MAKIIRHDQVDVSGSFQLNGSSQTSPAQAATPTEPDSENSGVQVRLIDRNAQASVLEVTCVCGEVIQIRCEHEPV